MVEGNYTQSSPPPSNDWHYVNIRGQNGSANVFTWKNKAGVEWDLIFVEEYSQYHYRFEVGNFFQVGLTICILDSGGRRLSLQQ